MSTVARKTEISPVDATPLKRMFWSIISDYDLFTGICELIDNAIDIWEASASKRTLSISLTLDVERQVIRVSDDAGGVPRADLGILITPGGSLNDPDAASIGIFGVGSKRAVVALAEEVAIQTRHGRGPTHEIDITKDWVHTEGWEMPAYEIPDIAANTTVVTLSQLRRSLAPEDPAKLVCHLGEVYGWFLSKSNILISVNGEAVRPIVYDDWAFPPGQQPRHAHFQAPIPGGESIQAEITAGLLRNRDAEGENYGVYFYCNNRLIVKALRTREVGYFVGSEAGVPHPDASLCRVVVCLNGKAKLMPWNSSKSGINYSNPAFQVIRPTLVQLTTHFSKLSRRTKDDWPGKVFSHTAGSYEEVDSVAAAEGRRLILPDLPRAYKTKSEHLLAKNQAKVKAEPWTLGLVEAVATVDVVQRQRLQTRNRINLILLDSSFEIAMKEFIVHREDLFPKKHYGTAKLEALFKNRSDVINEVGKHVTFPPGLLSKASHYYGLRCKLIHERATATVTDHDVGEYRDVVQKVLKILFKLRF